MTSKTVLPLAQLRPLVKHAAVKFGKFVLRSGRESTYYVDKFLIMSHPDLLRSVSHHLAKILPEGTAAVAGVELGGIPLVTAVSLASGLPAIFVRSTKKTYGTAKRIEGLYEKGMKVTLVEDVVTTAGAALDGIETLKAEGLRVLGVVAIVDRGEGGREAFAKAGVPFKPLFLIDEIIKA
jgi:orotate phosphoribosyltransferase